MAKKNLLSKVTILSVFKFENILIRFPDHLRRTELYCKRYCSNKHKHLWSRNVFSKSAFSNAILVLGHTVRCGMVRALFVRWTGKRTQSPTGRHLPMPVVVSTNARAQKDQGVPPLAADTVASEGDGAARAARVGRRTALAVQQQSTHPVPGAAPKPAEPPCLPAPLMLQTVPRSYAEPQLDARMPVKKHAEDEVTPLRRCS
jgi:hypothetical protein